LKLDLPPPHRRRLLAGLLGLCAGRSFALLPPASGRGLRLTVAYPPGGTSDDTARELARRLESRLGLRVIVDHKPGAGGAVAMEALSRARAEDAELCFSAITPLLQLPQAGPARFDPERDIAPVAAIMQTPVLVVATPILQAATLADVIALARKKPGALRWATSGHGTTGSLVLEQVRATAGVDITHVPYAGGGQQLNDALAGHFELLSSNVAARQLTYVREGRLRALAVGAPQRLAVLPEVPTLAELGFPSANLASLFGVFASARWGAERLEHWHAQIAAVLKEPDFRERLHAVGNLPADMSRQDFVRRIAAEAKAVRSLYDGASKPPR
jgi:tripartite-type tricarboxylate transporter receptor subunit TctC